MAFHKFFNTKYFITYLISSLTHGLFTSILFGFQIFGCFLEIFLLLASNLITLWSKNIFCDLNLLKFIETYLMTQNIVNHGKYSLCTLKECVIFDSCKISIGDCKTETVSFIKWAALWPRLKNRFNKELIFKGCHSLVKAGCRRQRNHELELLVGLSILCKPQIKYFHSIKDKSTQLLKINSLFQQATLWVMLSLTHILENCFSRSWPSLKVKPLRIRTLVWCGLVSNALWLSTFWLC